MVHPATRRSLLATGLALTVGAALLPGCGFQLRQPPQLAFRSVELRGFADNSPLANELARALEASNVDVVEVASLPVHQAAEGAASGAAAPAARPVSPPGRVIIEALTDRREQVVAATSAYGQVRELTLRTRLRFQVLRPDGRVVLAPTEVELSRDLTYNERDALAKQDEADALHLAMQTDIVGQVMRRLSALRLEDERRP